MAAAQEEGWDSLPTELLVEIFMLLNDHYRGEHAVMQVCRSWYVAAHHADLLFPKHPRRREYTRINEIQGFHPEGGMYSFFPSKTRQEYNAHITGMQVFQFVYYREKALQTLGLYPPVWSIEWHHLSSGAEIHATFAYFALDSREELNAVFPSPSEDTCREAQAYFEESDWWLTSSAGKSLLQTSPVLPTSQEDGVQDKKAHHRDPPTDDHAAQGIPARE